MDKGLQKKFEMLENCFSDEGFHHQILKQKQSKRNECIYRHEEINGALAEYRNWLADEYLQYVCNREK